LTRDNKKEKIVRTNRQSNLRSSCQSIFSLSRHLPSQFSQVVGEWLENQILIPDWTYFHYPGAIQRMEQQEQKEQQQSTSLFLRNINWSFTLCTDHNAWWWLQDAWRQLLRWWAGGQRWQTLRSLLQRCLMAGQLSPSAALRALQWTGSSPTTPKEWWCLFYLLVWWLVDAPGPPGAMCCSARTGGQGPGDFVLQLFAQHAGHHGVLY